MTTQNMIESPYSTTPTANTISQWDANKNISSNNSLTAYATTATSGGTTTLTVSSIFQQFFTGSSNQTVQMPVTSTLVLGQSYYIVNNSSGIITVTSSGGNTIISMNANTAALVTCILTSGTTATSWFATSYLPLSGGTMTGALSMGSHQINNVTDPTSPQDAATKNYVDNIASGLNPIPGVQAATTANLNATYSNGSSGVGATLTNAGSLSAFAVDGYSASVGDRILVKNQTSTFQNGIYTVTTVGSGAVAWVLTRATDYNTPAAINVGDLVAVANGTTNIGSSWLETAVVTTIGTSPITFSIYFNPANFLKVANNLSDVASASTSRTNLGAAASGANADISSMTGLTGYLQAPLGIKDSNGNVVESYNGTASAVNFITIANAITNTSPTVSASGSDSAINLSLASKASDFLFFDTTSTKAPVVRMYNAARTFYNGLQANSSLAANVSWQLPVADAKGFFMSNGSNVMSVVSSTPISITGSITVTGFSGSPSVVARNLVVGNMCYLEFTISGTSNSTSFSISGLPNAINATIGTQFYPILVTNNGTNSFGLAVLTGTGITFYLSPSSNIWTASGSKSAFGAFWYALA